MGTNIDLSDRGFLSAAAAAVSEGWKGNSISYDPSRRDRRPSSAPPKGSPADSFIGFGIGLVAVAILIGVIFWVAMTIVHFATGSIHWYDILMLGIGIAALCTWIVHN